MIHDNTLRVLYDTYTKRLNELADQVSEGRCANFEEYKHACGMIRGLYEAREEVETLAKKVENDE